MTTYGSLFSGVGGFDLGCDAAGWECKWQVEVDAKCRAVLRSHWPTTVHWDDVRTANGWDLEPVDVITFGFPCQDLSVAGKRAGLNGNRSGLFFEAIRIIQEMREQTCDVYPTVALAENVTGLLSADGGDAMGRCLDALAEVGALAVEWRVLDAQFFGVPQRRRRVFLVALFDPRAVSRGQVFPKPESVPGDPAESASTRTIIAGTAEARARERGTVAALTANGIGTCGADDNQAQAGHLIAFGHKQGIDVQPSTVHFPTLRVEGTGAAIASETLGVRRLTPLECERLMGWPDDHTRYSADGTEIADSARYRMCGNGVAAPVAKYVAECIEAILQ